MQRGRRKCDETMKSKRLIVHMVGNAHLDPAWLWTWPAGMDEALNTCRTACDLLDAYPEFHVTRGEAWVYDRILAVHPVLFKRIAAHVKAGRWHPVNGWWVQPDCNLPSPVSFRKQAEIGGRFFREKLGVKVKVGYNVDSFGHAAMLPTFLREAGMESYVFSRPNEQQCALPANLFRWRSPSGAEVLAFRIPLTYCSQGTAALWSTVITAIDLANREVGHTMCFYGVGDHGGGPTRDQIEWILEHRHFQKDVELRFSHSQAFFDAVKRRARLLPVVSQELQRVFPGCYSVVHDIKREVRRAEGLLSQAEALAREAGALNERGIAERLESAWKRVLFNEFHDVLAGSCVKSAYTMAFDELGRAKSEARDLIVELTRRSVVSLSPCPRQRLVAFNPSPEPWNGLVEFEPWLHVDGRPSSFVLTDGTGRSVTCQGVSHECAVPLGATDRSRMVFPVALAANGRCVWELHRVDRVPERASAVRVRGRSISNRTLRVAGGRHGVASLQVAGAEWLAGGGIRVGIFEDKSDTWGAGVAGFAVKPTAVFAAQGAWQVTESGPLRAVLTNRFKAEDATLLWQVFVDEDRRRLRMRLCLHWRGAGRVVKLIVPPAFSVRCRRDGVPGAVLERQLDGLEWPIRDSVVVAGRRECLAIVSADTYGADVQPDGTIRLTLLRCPPHAYMEGFPLTSGDTRPLTDQGEHEFEFSVMALPSYSASTILNEANRLNHPPWIAETTDGMPAGWRFDGTSRIDHRGVPVAPMGSVTAEGLMARVARSAKATLAPSETVCEAWRGERVMRSTSPVVRVRVPVTADGPCHIAVAHGVGAAYGKTELAIEGHPVGFLKNGARVAAEVSVFPDPVVLAKGTALFEFKRCGGKATALGFIHLVPAYRDIPANAWMVVGPFPFNTAVETVMKDTVFAPERSRNVDAPVSLPDGRQARWTRLTGNGDHVDFRKAFGQRPGSVHYAITHIRAARAHSARISMGVDYWMKVWVNGKVAQPYLTKTGGEKKGAFTFDVALEAGWNELLVKVAPGLNGNGFWMAITDTADLAFAVRAGKA